MSSTHENLINAIENAIIVLKKTSRDNSKELRSFLANMRDEYSSLKQPAVTINELYRRYAELQTLYGTPPPTLTELKKRHGDAISALVAKDPSLKGPKLKARVLQLLTTTLLDELITAIDATADMSDELRLLFKTHVMHNDEAAHGKSVTHREELARKLVENHLPIAFGNNNVDPFTALLMGTYATDQWIRKVIELRQNARRENWVHGRHYETYRLNELKDLAARSFGPPSTGTLTVNISGAIESVEQVISLERVPKAPTIALISDFIHSSVAQPPWYDLIVRRAIPLILGHSFDFHPSIHAKFEKDSALFTMKWTGDASSKPTKEYYFGKYADNADFKDMNLLLNKLKLTTTRDRDNLYSAAVLTLKDTLLAVYVYPDVPALTEAERPIIEREERSLR